MSRQTRTLLILGVMSVVAVIALSSMAQRYGKLLQSGAAARPEDPRAATVRLVDAFIQVRRAMIGAVSADGETPTVSVMRAARDRALFEAGLDLAEYRDVRDNYRAWREGSSTSVVPRPELVEAFESRREELAGLGLADYERWDS